MESELLNRLLIIYADGPEYKVQLIKIIVLDANCTTVFISQFTSSRTAFSIPITVKIRNSC